MESGNSEVAWRMERIRLEYESAQRGLMAGLMRSQKERDKTSKAA